MHLHDLDVMYSAQHIKSGPGQTAEKITHTFHVDQYELFVTLIKNVFYTSQTG